jgi:hypothetical protein
MKLGAACIDPNQVDWAASADVIVVGSGAAAFSAAITTYYCT